MVAFRISLSVFFLLICYFYVYKSLLVLLSEVLFVYFLVSAELVVV